MVCYPFKGLFSVSGIFNILSRIPQLQLTDHTHCSMESGMEYSAGLKQPHSKHWM